MRGNVAVLAGTLGLLLGGAAPARAQGIDCAKARTAAEKAICGAPSLIALDRQIALAYADALARQPDQAAAMRQDALRWLRERDAACAVPAARLARCLTGQMTARLAALAPPAVSATPAPVAEAPAPLPAVPSAFDPAPPAATVEPAAIQAAEQADALLQVTSPGRFAVSARSRTGVALQFVDMLTGPSDLAGEAGVRDGRLDLLLDVGAYKLRSFAAKGAAETVALLAEPFRDAAPPRALPPPGEAFSAALQDREQRSFWLLVPPSGEVAIEAAGRALADLRLWRGGRELAALEPAFGTVEPQPGHPLSDLRLSGRVEPGTYLVTAYGGPALPWSDGADAMPFHLRAGASEALAEGWSGGTVGPFGSEVFTLPAFAGSVRLDLPQPAAAELRLGDQVAALTRASREPHAVLRAIPGRAATVEVRGAAGQAYTLRASEPPGSAVVSRPGTYWISAIASGAGGDEVPPTVLLQRFDAQEPARIVASNLLRLTPGTPWRRRFNLRGPTALLFENAVGGPVAVRTDGVTLDPGAASASQYDVPADYYVLRLAPRAPGVIDVTVGAPRAAPPLGPPLPADPSIPLGVQVVGSGQRLQLLAQAAPGLFTGLSARPVPVALAGGPLTITQEAGGQAITAPVELAPGGTLAAREIGGGAVAVLDEPGAQPGARRVTVPASDRARTVVLSWHRAASAPVAVPAPPAPGTGAALRPGTPVPLNLARGQQRGFALEVAEGGLYRVETLGRLRTRGRIVTPFIAELDQAEANGVGQNVLLQRFLRAGRYRVDVGAVDSAGHLTVSASPAPLLAGADLLPGGSVRATMPAGTGAAFLLRISEAGRYRLDLLGLGRPFTARLDDAEGWPLTRPGDLSALEQDLQPGAYRLLVSPEPVARRVVTRLARVLPDVAISGHGPHPLPFGPQQAATWREPPGRTDPRAPDVWTFGLAGSAEVTLRIDDGMVAELRPQDAAPDARPLARVTRRWTGWLEAGAYRVEAASLGRNDRLDYRIMLDSKELQPGQVRSVTLPATVPFALADARVVSLTTWGTTPVKAVLRRADGTEAARTGARADDWNVAVSRLLPEGAYRVDLAAARPPEGGVGALPDQSASPPSDEASDDDQAAQAAPSQDTPDDAEERPNTPEQTVEIHLALPAARAPVDAPAEVAVLPGDGVHVLRLPQPAPGALLVAQAASAATSVLSLERRDGEAWRVVALEQGTRPLVAALADGDARPWRVVAWSVDGAAALIRLAARGLDSPAQVIDAASLAAAPGFPAGLAAARVRLDGPGVLSVAGADGMRAAGWAGHAAETVEAGQVVAQGDTLWLLAPGPETVSLVPLRIAPGGAQAVAIPAGGAAVLTADAAPGRLRLWRAESGLGQPGLASDGRQGGVASGAALALAGPTTTLRNAGGDDALRVRASVLDLALLPEQAGGPVLAQILPPGSALPVRLPGAGRVAVTLAPGTAALAGDVVAWAADAPLSRGFDAADTVLLVNTGALPAPVALAWTAGEPEPALRPGTVFKRFFGAAGSFDRAVLAGPDARIDVAGDATLQWQGADGRVLLGRSVQPNGNGRLVVSHGPGAVVLSVSAPGASPWPDAPPQAVQPPQRLMLSVPAMALSLAPDAPVLLHATTTAPVLLGVGDAPPELFAAGAEFHRALPAGPVTLRILSPHDGPLAGTLALSAEPIRPVAEGLGEAVAVAPGGSAAFGFTLARAAIVGLGVRADPDRAAVRLLDAGGAVLGEGVAQLRPLLAGRYVIEARVPPDAPPTTLRPAVVGITPPGRGPPPDVAQSYLELVGLKPVGATP